MSDTSSSPIGATLGRYRLLRKLARGGMAEVYAARSYGAHGFEKTVAVKCILPKYGNDPQFIRMLVDEAKISVLLNHPNIAQIYELGEHDGTYFIVMEFCAGQSLSTIVKRLRTEGTRMPVLEACFIVVELLQGLHAAHVQRDGSGKVANIIHRDVSPQNTLITFDGHVKVIDFGIARARDRLEATEVGTIKGKLRYLAPEMIDPIRFMKNGDFDHRVDVFAAGIVLWEMIAGRTLFEGEDELKVYELITDGKTPDLSAERLCDRALMAILDKALARDPTKRYPSAEAFADELRAYVYRSDAGFTVKRIAAVIDRVCGAERDELLALEQQPMPASQPRMPQPRMPQSPHTDPYAHAGDGTAAGSAFSSGFSPDAVTGTMSPEIAAAVLAQAHTQAPTVAAPHPFIDAMPTQAPMGESRSKSFSGPSDATMATLVSRRSSPELQRIIPGGNNDLTGTQGLNTNERIAVGKSPRRLWLPMAIGIVLALLVVVGIELSSGPPAPTTGQLVVRSGGVAATAKVGASSQATPATFELPLGPASLVVEAAGAPPVKRDVLIRAGTTTEEIVFAWDRVPVELSVTPAAMAAITIVTLDNTPITPTTTIVPGRRVRIAAQAPDHLPFAAEMDAVPGVPLRVVVNLVPVPPPPAALPADIGKQVPDVKGPEAKTAAKDDKEREPPKSRAMGTLVLKTLPYWANVVIDGKRYDETTPFSIELRAGSHSVELTHPPKSLSKRLKVVVKANDTVTRVVQFE